MHARGVELIAEVRTPRAGAELVVGPEHDVVCEQLRASVEQLDEGLLPVLGVEPIILVDGDPREPTAPLGYLLAELGVLILELAKLIASRPPLLAGSNRVLGHRSPPWGWSLQRRRRSRVVNGRPRRPVSKTGAPGQTHRHLSPGIAVHRIRKVGRSAGCGRARSARQAVAWLSPADCR